MIPGSVSFKTLLVVHNQWPEREANVSEYRFCLFWGSMLISD
uniref:Uncharacterized protein n=1 Tax=Setaria italica TaxID=4555 RepID=K4AP58_SETIT